MKNASDGFIGAASTLIKNSPFYNSGIGMVSTCTYLPYSWTLTALKDSGTSAIIFD